MDIPKETINRILGKLFMECAHLDLVVHAHRAEHKIENIEHYDAYRNALFLLGATFTKKLYNAKAVNEP